MGGKSSTLNTPQATDEGIILKGYFRDVYIEFLFTKESGYTIQDVNDATVEQAMEAIKNSEKIIDEGTLYVRQIVTIKWKMTGFQKGRPFVASNRYDITQKNNPTFPSDFTDEKANNWSRALMQIAKGWKGYVKSDPNEDLMNLHTGFQPNKIF